MHPIASHEVTSTCSRLSITRKILLPKMFSKESVPPKNSVMKSNSHLVGVTVTVRTRVRVRVTVRVRVRAWCSG